MSKETPLYSLEELRALLEREEGQFLEFKSLWDRNTEPPKSLERRKVRDLVAEAIAAFANADGGVLLLGVDDDGTPSGHAYPEEAVAEILAVPEKRLRPSVSCRTERIRIDAREVLVFDVPLAPEAVMVDGNGFPYRVGDRIVREPQEVVNQRKQAYRVVGYEARIQPEATLDDLDLELARRFLADTALGKRGVEELLLRYGLVHEQARGLAVTNGALLLFAREPALRWHPRAGIRFFRVAGTKREHGTRRNVTQLERFDPPLAEAIPSALRHAASQVRRSEKLHDLFFKETPEYPEFAWQEALVNAIAHRDYEVQGHEIEVWLYDDRMEVRSPGELVPPVTLEALRQHRSAHASRNPLLVRVLVEARIMRDEGEGIPRMFDEMEESFLRAPELGVEHATFQVTLYNELIFVGPSAEWQKLVAGLPINVAQKRVLLAHPERFTNEDYRRLSEVDPDLAYREIQELVNLGLILPTGTGRGASYHVAPDLHRTRAFLEARLPRLREHFRREERLTNADFRQMFGLTRYAAVNDLRRLVDEGFLRMEGQRRGTHYRPLPALGGESGK